MSATAAAVASANKKTHAAAEEDEGSLKRKEFAAAQMRFAELAAEHRRVVESVARKEHEQNMARLTLRELGQMGGETPVYRTIGKAFVRSSMDQVQERLESVGSLAVSEGERLRGRRAQLEMAMAATEERVKLLYKELQE